MEHITRFLKTSLILLFVLFFSNLAAQVGTNSAVLNPNLATENELVTLPHFTSELAETVIAQRPYLDMLEFDALIKKHLNKEEASELYIKLFVPINLNTATNDEIRLVPGVGDRMTHEFEEYKPYKALAQFRREIGKYVDDTELKRLEQFVFVPINLNEASDEDILTIPGLGQRMLREFKEYRPYKSLSQFQREIGKYVDDNEVARLERYIVLE